MPDNVISSSFSFLKARQGTSAFVVNLDNEMTSIVVDEHGDTTDDIELNPLLSAFYGSQNVISDCTVNVSCDDPDMTAEYNATTHCVDISIQEDTHLSQVTTITISVVHSSYGTRTITFTIAAVPKGEGAFIQELLPSINEVSFARTSSGSLTPASRSISLSIKRTDGNSTSSESISSSGLTVRWSVSSVPSSASSGNAWGSGTSVTGITWNSGTMVIANSVAETNIYIAAFNSAGTLVDRETIPIVKDGENGEDGEDGEDAPAAFASVDKIVVQCSADGSVKSSKTVDVSFSLKVGTHVATVSGFSSGTKPTGVTVQSRYTNVCSITIGTSATASGISNGVTFTVTGTYGGKTYSASVTVALIGATQGTRGKVGRFFYYGGVFNASDTTTSFVVNDAQSPFFSYNDNYWVYNPEDNPSGGTTTMSAMGTPSSSSVNWEIMTSDFKYLITEAMFTNFAKLASAIFSGDWMLSQYGVPSRVISTTEKNLVYMCVNVDGQYPVSDLATLLDDADLWDEYKEYGYTDAELESVADVCQWAVSAMPNNSDEVRYNVIQTLSDTSYQWFGVNQSDLFSVFNPNISLDFLRGKAYFNDCSVRGNLVGRTSSPLTSINMDNWTDYGVQTTDDYGYTRHYLFMNRMPTWNVQLMYMSGSETPTRRLILPVITKDTLGTEIIVVNASGEAITVEGKPEKSTYMAEGSYLLDGIQTEGYSNNQRTIVMNNQTILKFVSVEIPLQFGEYGWIAQGVPQTIES